MKISTKFYRMRRKNKKGFLLLGILFLFIVVIVIGGTRFLLSPTSINSSHDSISNFKHSSKITTKSSIKHATKTSSKVTTNNSKGNTTTNSSSANIGNSNGVVSSTTQSYYADSQAENQLNYTTTQEQINTPTIYYANYEGYVGTSTISNDDAFAKAQNQYNVAVEEQKQTAISIAQSYAQKGYETHIIQDEGGN